MFLLNKINASPKQNYTLVTDTSEQVGFYLYYAPSLQRWFFDISYGEFVLRGVQLTVAPNILRSYRNLIPFGIACTSIDGMDPYYITDFSLGRIQLYMLSEAEVEEIEASFFS